MKDLGYLIRDDETSILVLDVGVGRAGYVTYIEREREREEEMLL